VVFGEAVSLPPPFDEGEELEQRVVRFHRVRKESGPYGLPHEGLHGLSLGLRPLMEHLKLGFGYSGLDESHGHAQSHTSADYKLVRRTQAAVKDYSENSGKANLPKRPVSLRERADARAQVRPNLHRS